MPEKDYLVRTQDQQKAEDKFRSMGHAHENTACDHKHWRFDKHGRYCTCGIIMCDFGD